MDNVRIAEWILAEASSKERAGEIVGDLLEQQKSMPAFWASILRIVLAMQWRWLVAVPAAMFAVALALKPYADFVVAKEIAFALRIPPTQHGVQPMSLTLTIGKYLIIPAMCLWTVAALASIRYGLRGLVTRLSLFLAVLFTAGSCSLEIPHTLVAVPTMIALILLALFATSRSRRALGCILLSGTTFAGGFMMFAYCMALLLELSLGKNHDHGLILLSLLAFASLFAYAACIVVESWVLARTRRWLLPSE